MIWINIIVLACSFLNVGLSLYARKRNRALAWAAATIWCGLYLLEHYTYHLHLIK